MNVLRHKRPLLHGGLILALGLAACPSFAQEIQWRASTAPVATSTPSENSSVTLGRPQPLQTPAPPTALTDVTPVNFRPANTVIGANIDTVRPLPSGPAFGQGPTTVIIEDAPQNEKKDPKEAIPFAPKRLNGDLEPGTVSGSSPVCYPLCCPPHCCQGFVCRERCWDSCCWDNCGGGCESGCIPRARFWLMGEYLMWNLSDQRIPPLVTTSPPGTPVTEAGVLGAPGTTVLFDERNMFNAELNGGRFTLGFWLPCYSDVGLETSFFFLSKRNYLFSAASEGTPILARPIFDVVQGTEVSQLVAFPGVLSGSINVEYDTRMWGLDFGFRHKLCCDCRSWLDLTYGYRHLYHEDNIDIIENLLAAQPLGGPLGIIVHDSFQTRNIFNGLYLGIEGERKLFRRWFVGGYGKLTLGVNHQVININGTTTFSTVAPGVANPQPAGILALPTNIGHHTRDRFSAIPEFGFKFGYCFNDHFRLWVGWSGMWWGETVRAGEQIDRGINRTQVPNNLTGIGPLVGERRPSVPFRTQDMFVNGLNAGLEYRY